MELEGWSRKMLPVELLLEGSVVEKSKDGTLK
jgi:hypothetical protein